jgi:hypothetical protein
LARVAAAQFARIVTAVTARPLQTRDDASSHMGDQVMQAQARVLRFTERQVVDRGSLRSQPRVMRVTLPALRCLDDMPLVPGMQDDDDWSAGRGRDAG